MLFSERVGSNPTGTAQLGIGELVTPLALEAREIADSNSATQTNASYILIGKEPDLYSGNVVRVQ